MILLCSQKLTLQKNNVMWITSFLSLALLLFTFNFIRVIVKRNAHKYQVKPRNYYFKGHNHSLNRVK